MKKIAVFFGGRSYEHDVSILTGLQVCRVMDVTKFDPIPVYVNKAGRIFSGPELLNPKFYPVLEFRESKLTELIIPVGETYPCLQHRFGILKKKIPFDIAFLAFHGSDGENGGFQGLFQTAGIPYTGADLKSSAAYMDKIVTKQICRGLGIKVLDEFTARKPAADFFDVKKLLADFPLKFPVMAKPRSLGSSVGIARADDAAELESAVVRIFKLGDDALCEPFVENLVEYNIAVMRDKNGKIITSAIERPNANGGALSFADKYLGDEKKKGAKKKTAAVMPSKELLAARREYNPRLTAEQEDFIRGSAVKLFAGMGGTGAPRMDFIGNGETGEIWLNEVNPIPGAFAFYLWAASGKNPMTYQELADAIIANANMNAQSIDLNQSASVIFK